MPSLDQILESIGHSISSYGKSTYMDELNKLYTSRLSSRSTLNYVGRGEVFVVMDDFIDIIPSSVQDEPDWKRTKFVSGGSTDPSKSKKAKLRKKRKPKRKYR